VVHRQDDLVVVERLEGTPGQGLGFVVGGHGWAPYG
jgi:hypothetical protein